MPDRSPTPCATDWRPRFFVIWVGQQLSVFGSAIAAFALVWWLTATTGSATVLAMGTLFTLLPGVLLGPFAGALVDRWSRRRVMMLADSLIALFSLWLAVLFWAGTARVGYVYVIMLARAIGGTFHLPAMQASTALMVPDKHLPRVSGLNQTVSGAIRIVAPPIGALALALLPMHGIMGIDVVTAALAVGPLFFVTIPHPRRRSAIGTTPPSLWADVKEGFGTVWHWPGMNGILFISMTISLFVFPAMSLTPILATQVFGGAAFHLGWLSSAWGLGAVAGGLILGAWGGFRRRIVTVLVGAAGLGLGILMVGIAPTRAFGMALAGMFLAASLYTMCTGAGIALLQTLVPPELQGRVLNLVVSLSTGIAPLGMVVAGPVADAVGVRAWFIAGGVVTLGMAGIAALTPSVIHLEDASTPTPERSEVELPAHTG
jgi:DHA3 family macrolide efflux protein-like MFS transporter